ncbi:unnamed protein product [Ectocarpus sp. 12 AP-2014]
MSAPAALADRMPADSGRPQASSGPPPLPLPWTLQPRIGGTSHAGPSRTWQQPRCHGRAAGVGGRPGESRAAPVGRSPTPIPRSSLLNPRWPRNTRSPAGRSNVVTRRRTAAASGFSSPRAVSSASPGPSAAAAAAAASLNTRLTPVSEWTPQSGADGSRERKISGTSSSSSTAASAGTRAVSTAATGRISAPPIERRSSAGLGETGRAGRTRTTPFFLAVPRRGPVGRRRSRRLRSARPRVRHGLPIAPDSWIGIPEAVTCLRPRSTTERGRRRRGLVAHPVAPRCCPRGRKSCARLHGLRVGLVVPLLRDNHRRALARPLLPPRWRQVPPPARPTGSRRCCRECPLRSLLVRVSPRRWRRSPPRSG